MAGLDGAIPVARAAFARDAGSDPGAEGNHRTADSAGREDANRSPASSDVTSIRSGEAPAAIRTRLMARPRARPSAGLPVESVRPTISMRLSPPWRTFA